MADAKDQVERARVALRRAIAGALVRQEQAQEALERLRGLIEARTEDRALAESAGDTAVLADVDRALADLREQVAVHEQALATAEADQSKLKEELRSMDGLARQADRLAAVSAVREAAEPPAVEQATLDRVRASILDLESEAKLNAELSPTRRLDREIEEAAAEAAAKAKLAELKAKHAQRANDPAEAGDDGASDGESPAPKPKRSL